MRKEIFTMGMTLFLLGCLVLATMFAVLPFTTKRGVSSTSEYYTKGDIALYLKTYKTLPKNFISEGEKVVREKGLRRNSFYVEGGDIVEGLYELRERENIPDEVDLFICDVVDNINTYDCYHEDTRGTERLVYYFTKTGHCKVFYTDKYGVLRSEPEFREVTTKDIDPYFVEVLIWSLSTIGVVFGIFLFVLLSKTIYVYIRNKKK